jgi:hypothetical protein
MPFSRAGGFDVEGGSGFVVRSSTIALNSAAQGANAVFNAPATFKNTVVSDPQGGGSSCVGGGPVTSQGYNIEDHVGCNFSQPTDKLNTDPMLSPAGLADNGGLTKTIALLAGSPAIDQGVASLGETFDQRGRGRPVDDPSIPNASGGDSTDVGAFEVQPAPDTLINAGPGDGSVSNDAAPVFDFLSPTSPATFQCSLDGASFTACSSPDALGPLADGQHTFSVRAVDVSAQPDPTPATRTFTVDTSGPDTSITSGPAEGAFVNDPSPSFGFSATESPGTFACSVDGGPFAACSSPDAIGPLADGNHSFSVEASDAVANVDPSPASRAFTVDTLPPQTKLVKPPGKRTRHRKLKLRFRSSEPSTFECKLDRKSFKPCTSPYTTRKLTFKGHVFQVRAIDRAGNADGTVAKRKFRVVRPR